MQSQSCLEKTNVVVYGDTDWDQPPPVCGSQLPNAMGRSASTNDEIVALKERMQLYEEREKIREKESEEYRATIQALLRQVGCNISLSCNASPSTDFLNTTNL